VRHVYRDMEKNGVLGGDIAFEHGNLQHKQHI